MSIVIESGLLAGIRISKRHHYTATGPSCAASVCVVEKQGKANNGVSNGTNLAVFVRPIGRRGRVSARPQTNGIVDTIE
ncbi:hypothetical protein EVAR_20792_1 [Eumeta japonica]|uniref:Uncharacterized protein n=1 Tax=Eumeta variegata TaxID=151549 RepID=A0A4C1UDL2_EUMVA|nr:hypothetical protein EVAR_20792_1 [Eumeta japonica]